VTERYNPSQPEQYERYRQIRWAVNSQRLVINPPRGDPSPCYKSSDEDGAVLRRREGPYSTSATVMVIGKWSENPF
jgi:hypothetical protein